MERCKQKSLSDVTKWVGVMLLLALIGGVAGYAFSVPQAAPMEMDYTQPAKWVAEKCLPSVVGIQCLSGEQAVSEGSGVILSSDGYILTNNHVVDGAGRFQVRFHDGRVLDATLRGGDESTDLAVLKADAQGLTPVAIGQSSEAKVGETVVAIGSPGGLRLANSLTSGVVSGLGRRLEDENLLRVPLTIQHDAAINPGNSGGALFNADGELIGINTLKYSGSAYDSVTYQGLGFAIPVDAAMPIARQLMELGRVPRPQMGAKVATSAVSNAAGQPLARVCIAGIVEDGPAEEAGLQRGDYILNVEGTPIWSLIELTRALDAHQENEEIEMEILRPEGARYHTFSVHLTLRVPDV